MTQKSSGPSPKKKRLGELLIEKGLITQQQLDRAVEVQRAKGGKLGQIIVDLNLCPEEIVLSVMAARFGMPFVSSLSAYGSIPVDVVAMIPARTAREQSLIPLAREGNLLTVAMADPVANVHGLDELKILTGCTIKPVLATEREILSAVNRYYAESAAAPLTPAPVVAPEAVRAIRPDDAPADAQMDNILDALLESAVKNGASHVYLEPAHGSVRVRYRVNGGIHVKPDLPGRYQLPVTARVKARARLNAAECWVPQDGRLRTRAAGRDLDVKVSTLPTSDGEAIVLHVMDTAPLLPADLTQLGLEPDVLEPFRKAFNQKKGLVLVVGPTGAGKTTTLYATLAALNTPDRHILTIEDPIERYVEGVTQIQTRPDLRLTLDGGLYVLHRQDSDVLFVLDVHDLETAEAAAAAAADDCLVLSAVNATDALNALGRLRDMGLSPALLSTSLVALLAQRLVRTLCPHCREPYTLSMRQLLSAGVSAHEIKEGKRADSFTLYKGRGCGHCLATGYRGTAAVFEILTVNDAMRRLIAEKAPLDQIAREVPGRVTLREAALRKALAGVTSLDEALKLG
jgi:type IV pilus assembly protein PilB